MIMKGGRAKYLKLQPPRNNPWHLMINIVIATATVLLVQQKIKTNLISFTYVTNHKQIFIVSSRRFPLPRSFINPRFSFVSLNVLNEG